jgi:tetratricopeptide (TPR) repeat protein
MSQKSRGHWELKKKGDELLKSGNFEGAREYYQKSIDLDPGWVPVWTDLETVSLTWAGRMM